MGPTAQPMNDGRRVPARSAARDVALGVSGIAVFVVLWAIGAAASRAQIIPGPRAVFVSLVHLALTGALLHHAVASLFRVTWGYLAAVLVGIPLGLWLGASRRADDAINPFVQILRPISPLAWIPLAILWFGVGDPPAVFIIFIGSVFPIAVATSSAVVALDPTHVHVAENFGLSRWQTVRRVILPAILPQLLVGLRVTLGIAWLIVVAAEMLAVNSGLGFLIIDSRNAGNRYDLVVAGMLVVGSIGLALDAFMRRIEKTNALRWSAARGDGGDET